MYNYDIHDIHDICSILQLYLCSDLSEHESLSETSSVWYSKLWFTEYTKLNHKSPTTVPSIPADKMTPSPSQLYIVRYIVSNTIHNGNKIMIGTLICSKIYIGNNK